MQVTTLGIVPVKGMQWTPVDALDLSAGGAAGDRAFFVVEADGRLLNTERNPALMRVRPAWDAATRTLALGFPDGGHAHDVVEPAEPLEVEMYDGRRVAGHAADGVLAEALSEWLCRPVRLFERDPGTYGADDAPLSLVSEASVATLGADPRRYRMNVTVNGCAAWGEEALRGEVRLGGAVLRMDDPIGRCVVINRDPETAETDAPLLKTLATLRGKRQVTLGVWAQVAEPGRVRVGDELVATGASDR
jgi:uncharacterized protein YcbX